MTISLKQCFFALVLFLPASLSICHAAERMATVTLEDGYRLQVEIADTKTQRERGLMHRTQLGADAGMLFVYPDQDIRGVWMKNTRLALDVLFLSADGKVVSILPNLAPCAADPCRAYSSMARARYMLEANSGFVGKHRITVGQRLKLVLPPNPH
jgi:uncharacterized membrane protein (UPF0127 family)